MTEPYTQQDRMLSIETPLGKDKLLLRSMSGHEAISQLFEFRLELISEDPKINFDKIVGQNITVGITLSDGVTERYLNGYISRFTQLTEEDRLGHYEAVMVPWLWFLTRTTDCRIFQNQTVPQIVKQVFASFGFSNFEDRLQRSYDPWEYCVQYRETACNFVMRLMEQEGIFFFFEHTQGAHTLVLGDLPTAHKLCPYQPTVEYEYSGGPGKTRDEDMIRSWRVDQEMRPGRYTVNEFNFTTPNSSLVSQVLSLINQGGNSKYEIYDYPGEYETRKDADAWVKLRMEEEELTHIVITGHSDCRCFSPGYRFTLSGFDMRPEENTTYLLTSVSHSAQEGSFFAGDVEAGASYSNSFTCIPWSVPFRPPRLTPRPLVQGSQTAVVVGPAGEEIYTDIYGYGQVKVHFHWDRYGARDENSSCWIRVATPWAGKQWGAIHIPRIGQEVVVDFLEGDPDRPIITGSVYNGRQMPPYTLPANQTMSTVKSCSSKGGGGFNEIRFEDKKGKEQVFVHAQRNMDVRVVRDQMTSVGVDRHETVGGVDQNGALYGDLKLLVYNDLHQHVKCSVMAQTEGNSALIVGRDAYEWYQSSHRQTVANEEFVEAPTIAFEAGQTISLKAPTIILEASQTLSLVGPGGCIVIDASGVAIEGTMVKINCGGAQPQNAITTQIGSGPIQQRAKPPSDPVPAANDKPGQPSNT